MLMLSTITRIKIIMKYPSIFFCTAYPSQEAWSLSQRTRSTRQGTHTPDGVPNHHNHTLTHTTFNLEMPISPKHMFLDLGDETGGTRENPGSTGKTCKLCVHQELIPQPQRSETIMLTNKCSF